MAGQPVQSVCTQLRVAPGNICFLCDSHLCATVILGKVGWTGIETTSFEILRCALQGRISEMQDAGGGLRHRQARWKHWEHGGGSFVG